MNGFLLLLVIPLHADDEDVDETAAKVAHEACKALAQWGIDVGADPAFIVVDAIERLPDEALELD